MAVVDFNNAVRLSSEYIKEIFDSDKSQLGIVIRGKEAPMFIGPSSPLEEAFIRRKPSSCVDAAKTDLVIHEALKTTACDMFVAGKRLPREVELWLMQLELGIIAPPTERGRDRTDRVEGVVYHSVAALVIRAGFKATRNIEIGRTSELAEERSACDVVAKAFAQVGRQLDLGQLPRTYETVKSYWHVSKTNHPFYPAEYSQFMDQHPTRIWNTLGEFLPCRPKE